MASCLGINLSSNIVKYAKLTTDNVGNVRLDAYGVRYVRDNQKETLKNIIEETNSQNIPIAMNPQNDRYINYQMFDQSQVKGKDIAKDVAKMEFEAWCEKNAKSPEKYSYVYKVSDQKNEENKFNSILSFIEKKYLDEYKEVDKYKISNILPSEFLMYRLVPKNEKNYMLVDLDDILTIAVVIDGKIVDIKYFDTGMKQILFDFSTKLGSYQKAYESCKQLNVYSDEETNNDKVLESIAEPVLQDVLRYIGGMGRKYKEQLNKVLLSGNGIVFTNIDILIKEYLDIRCEILKPDFVQNISNVRNIAEILETTQAMSLAYEVLFPENKELEYLNTKFGKKLGGIFSKKNNEKKLKVTPANIEPKKTTPSGGVAVYEDKSLMIATNVLIGLVIILIGYISFSGAYIKIVDKTLAKIDEQKNKVTSANANVKNDIEYISSNTSDYKEINDEVQAIKEKIENNQIGKFSTYNVASFLQNIIKIIPKNVQLKSISSDDNKNIKITALSNNYSDLGYFVSELKLKSTLNNVKINSIKNGQTTVIEIGGELP